MASLLATYFSHASTKNRILSVETLMQEGQSETSAKVTLHRLRKEGVAVSAGPGKVRLLTPGEKSAPAPKLDWEQALTTRFKVKATGFSVLPQRFLVDKPRQFIVTPNKLDPVVRLLNERGIKVTVGKCTPTSEACLVTGQVRGRHATPEAGLLHVYRTASRDDFALALQALLMEGESLNWDWLRRQPEWPEIAGVFVAVNESLGRKVFPNFRVSELPDMSLSQIDTVAQAVSARGQST